MHYSKNRSKNKNIFINKKKNFLTLDEINQRFEIIRERPYPHEISKKSYKNKNIEPKNLMNNSFLTYQHSIFQNISIDNDRKRAKSNQSINKNSINNNDLDELKIIEPYKYVNNENNISKILSFKANKTKKVNNIKKDYLKDKFKSKSKYNNLNNKNYNTLENKSFNSNKSRLLKKKSEIIKKISPNSKHSKEKKKKNKSINLNTINIINNRRKIIKKQNNYKDYSAKLIPRNNIINSEKIRFKKKQKFSNYLTKKKDNINTIHISCSSRQNSISTNLNSSFENKYSPKRISSSKKNSILNNKVPKEFVYVKKINKNNKFKNNSFSLSKRNSKEKISNYNKFQDSLNKIKIDDINYNDYINCNIDENDNISEKIEKKIRASYIGQVKTFEEIEKKNLNMTIINKILNNNLKIQTYNFNNKNNEKNEIFYFTNRNNDDINYNNLKTATFALCENEK